MAMTREQRNRQRAFKRLDAKGCRRLWDRFVAVNNEYGAVAASRRSKYGPGPKTRAKMTELNRRSHALSRALRKAGCV